MDEVGTVPAYMWLLRQGREPVNTGEPCAGGGHTAGAGPGAAGAGTSTKHANTGCRKDFFRKKSSWHDPCWAALRVNQ